MDLLKHWNLLSSSDQCFTDNAMCTLYTRIIIMKIGSQKIATLQKRSQIKTGTFKWCYGLEYKFTEADMTTLWRIIRDVSLTINGYFTIQVSVLLVSYFAPCYWQNTHGLTTIIVHSAILNPVVIVSAILVLSILCYIIQRHG